ncbi:MAG: IS21 family transposase [Betaproteobacteria bacterium]
MRRLRDVLRLKYDTHLPLRAIAQACGLGLGTVSTYLQRAATAGLIWPLPDDLDDAALEARLFTRPSVPTTCDRVLPNWATLHQELKKPGVTLTLLWQEYRGQHPHGYAYSQFCERYRQWARRLKPSMRQVHRAGEKLFVDFSGKRPHLVDPTTGEAVAVELFVGVLGASGLIYAEATRRQDLPSWVSAHIRMLEYVHGSTAVWVPDQLKSGVTTASRYEPEINRTYVELARHYGAVVIPARPATPTDKPLVEVSVQIAQRWVMAALRHRTFFTLADLNAAIRERIDAINDRPMKAVGVSRRTLFEQIDRPALKPLPAARYELAEWKGCRVNIDYHIEIAHNFYSVPYQLVHERIEARFTATTVEVFFKNRPVAAHARLTGRGRCATQVAHMPRAHRAHAEWTPSRLIAWANQTGPATGRVVTGILERRPHPEQGYRACLGLMRLGRQYGADRLEAACARAERLRSYRFRTVEHILMHQQDRLPLDEPPARLALTHENLRGATYYEEVYADPAHD